MVHPRVRVWNGSLTGSTFTMNFPAPLCSLEYEHVSCWSHGGGRAAARTEVPPRRHRIGWPSDRACALASWLRRRHITSVALPMAMTLLLERRCNIRAVWWRQAWWTHAFPWFSTKDFPHRWARVDELAHPLSSPQLRRRSISLEAAWRPTPS